MNALSLETLEPIVKECRSIDAVLAKLDMPLGGRANRELSRRLHALPLDLTHFQGRTWSKGFTRKTHPSIEKYASKYTFPDEIVFIENGPFISGPNLVRRLRAKGMAYECTICGGAAGHWCFTSITSTE